jgi:hypothetical protein
VTEVAIASFLFDFLKFLANALYEVPLEISIGSAMLLTFIWLANELFGRMSLWRVLLVTIWGLVFVDAFLAPVSTMSKEQVWFIALLIGAFMIVLERELRGNVGAKLRSRLRRSKGGRPRRTCPHCGRELPEITTAKPTPKTTEEQRTLAQMSRTKTNTSL